jgi:NAD(P)-dependent dehydrogenase (short-subunit alcohol dehydrogenase family)
VWGDAREHAGVDPFDLSGQVAIVTGGGTGIGRAIALLLSRHGATVALASRTAANLERVAGEVRDQGGTAVTIPTDVCDPPQCRALVERVASEHGRLDVVVNNAGGTVTKAFDQWRLEDWEQVVNLNLRAVWLMCMAALPIMAEAGKGAIVNISSGASLIPVPSSAPYGAAKAGINNLTMQFAAQFGKAGVRTNAIAVGAVKSEAFVENMQGIGRDPDEVGGRNTLGRAGWPIEIAWPVLFLASDASSYLNGQTVYINGGTASAPLV